jgi:uncharacterized SAM-binding protein YcdF (DUF218 family)
MFPASTLMYHVFSDLLNPFPAFLVLLGLAIVLSYRNLTKRRFGLLVMSYMGLFASSTPMAAYLMLRPLEAGFSRLHHRPADTEAIVVLAGGAWRSSDSVRGVELAESTLVRCLEAARLYHAGPPCTIYASGGAISGPGTPASHAGEMRHLLGQLAVPESDVVVETNSTSTYENAVETSKLLAENGVNRIVLVTDAAHLPRARRCFEARGIDVTSAGARFQTSDFRLGVRNFLPSTGGIQGTAYASHEWLGLAWYWLRGRI